MPKPKGQGMRKVEICVTSELLDIFDAWWKSNHFPTRNEALRQVLREKLDRYGIPVTRSEN
jgi:metal-responsive CopG/Arc/MetJ family transcriptional regulator